MKWVGMAVMVAAPLYTMITFGDSIGDMVAFGGAFVLYGLGVMLHDETLHG